MSVSIRTPKAFSMRNAMSPERSALPLSRLREGGPGNVKRRRRPCHRQASRDDNLRPDETSGMERVLYRHGLGSFVLVVIFQIHVKAKQIRISTSSLDISVIS
jgi:hypothetical protein